MDTTEESKKPTKHGQQPSTTRSQTHFSHTTSSKQPTRSLVSEAAMILQSHDEWMMQCEETNYMDTGDALNQLESMRLVLEKLINE